MTDSLVAVVGTDPTMVNDAAFTEIATLLDGLDPALALEDLLATATTPEDQPSVARRAIEALNTPPFLVDRRVVVVRDAHALTAEEVGDLLVWAASPLAGVSLVVTLVGARAKGKLTAAATRVVDVGVGSRSSDRLSYVSDTLAHHGVRVSAAIVKQIADQVGDELARVDQLARTLHSIFGGVAITFEQIAPYLGDEGGVPEWDLTDAIDRGDTAKAIATVQRMIGAGSRSGLQIVNILQRHYLRVARLEGSGASSDADAVAIVGGSAFPARKQMQTARLLGSDRVARAVALVAQADRDMKGGVDYGAGEPNATDLTVTEVLVARLARLSEGARRS
jgi:DNA polymerase-3 subunit delta